MAEKPTYEELKQGGTELEDVTSQHGGIERHFQQTELFYSMVLQNMSDAVFLTDDSGTFVYICPNVEVIFGYSLDEVRKMLAIDKLLGEQSSIRKKLKTSNELVNISCDITDKAGTIRSLLVNVKRVSIKGGTTLYVCRDITERKRLEEKLREAHNQLEIRVKERTRELTTANERLKQELQERKKTEEALRNAELERRTILDHQEDLVVLQDFENRIIWANEAAGKSIGLRREAMIGRFCYEFWAGASETCPDCAVAKAIKTGKPQSIEKTTPDGRAWRIKGCPIRNERGEITHALEVAEDITERKRVEQERIANVHFLESMDRVNRAIQGTNDLEQMMSDVLDEVLSIFDCDRAALVYPCDPEAQSWTAPMERFRPPYEGVLALGLQVPMDDEVAFCHRLWRSSDGPVPFGQEHEIQIPDGLKERFQIQTQLGMAIYPKDDRPWLFVIHQCSRSRFWQERDMRLLEEIGRRLNDGLNSLSMYRDLKEKESKYRELADSITDVFFAMDTDLKYTYWNRASENLTGVKAEDAIGKTIFEVSPDTKETRKAAAVYEDVLKKKQPKSFENEYRLEDKHHFLEINAYPTGDGISVFAKDIAERKRAEEALERSRREWETTFNAMSDWVVLLDLDYRILYSNRAGEEITGLPKERIIGQAICKLVHGTDEPIPECPAKRMFETHQPERYEVRIPERDGWFMVTVDPVRDEAGNTVGAVHVARDTTERKRAEEALKQEALRRSTLMAGCRDGIAIINQEHKLVEANERFAEMLGYTQEEILDLHTWDWEAMMTEEEIRLNFADLAKTDAVFETRHRRKDGTIFDVEVSASGTELDNEPFAFTICRDITERRQAEEALKHSNDMLRAIIESAPTAIIGLDLEGKVHSVWNPAAEKMLGWSAQEVMGRPLPSVPTEKQNEFRGFRERVRSGKTLDGVEVRRQKRDGSSIDYSIYGSPLHDVKGRITGNVAVLVDITERKRSEKALKKKEKELEEQAIHLEEANAALKVVLELRDKERHEFEERIVTNVKKMVFPYLDDLDKGFEKARHRTCVSIIRSNLEHLISPFASKLSEKTMNLTPTELRVADMIKHGKTSKEIASMLNVSPDAILFHRKNIRKRLGIAKKKTNLRSYLQSLSTEA